MRKNPKREMDGLSTYYFCAAETARLTLTPYFRKILAGCLPAIVADAPPICVALKAIPHFTIQVLSRHKCGRHDL